MDGRVWAFLDRMEDGKEMEWSGVEFLSEMEIDILMTFFVDRWEMKRASHGAPFLS